MGQKQKMHGNFHHFCTASPKSISSRSYCKFWTVGVVMYQFKSLAYIYYVSMK